jgi:transposase
LALVALSVIEQRYRAVMAVLDGASPTEVAAEVGVSRQSVHAWLARYRASGLAGSGGEAEPAAVEPEPSNA